MRFEAEIGQTVDCWTILVNKTKQTKQKLYRKSTRYRFSVPPQVRTLKLIPKLNIHSVIVSIVTEVRETEIVQLTNTLPSSHSYY